MKNHILSLFIFVFIFGLFNINFTSAVNCASGDLFDSATGARCNTKNSSIIECPKGDSFNTVTGERCNTWTENSSNNTIYEFQIGARGESVKAFQQILSNGGFLFGKIDGIYGPITDAAAKNYYKKYPRPLPPIFPPEPCPLSIDASGVITHVCPPSLDDGAPVISGVSGPQLLDVNEKGSWTVKASSPSGGNLSYSVVWGDEVFNETTMADKPSSWSVQQSAIFTHSYSQAGKYKIIFNVTSENTIRCIKAPCPSNGGSAQASLSVIVGDIMTDDNDEAPKISYLSPGEGPVGTKVNIYGTGLSDSTIYFGGYPVDSARIDYSDSGNIIYFIVPTNLNNCYGAQMCTMIYRPIADGKYDVYVTNKNGKSNSVVFLVTGSKLEL